MLISRYIKKFLNFSILAALCAVILFKHDIAVANSIKIDLDTGESGITSRVIQMLGLITILSLAPAILVMVTSFTRIVVVLSIIRSALGLQQTPPASVLTSLALFLTFFIMTPTFQAAYDEAISPLINNKITEEVAWEKIQKPFHEFMMKNVREKELSLFTDMAQVKKQDAIPMNALIPAFMISELRRAFEIGFLIFLPFLIIDILTASVLMAMGMMMLPPVMISLPFKIIFFVLIDGWYMVCGSLAKSYGM